MKYGIMYDRYTDNIGDDIQTYTALKFLPHIDYWIEREDLNCFIPKEKELVAMIMNGWFLHNKAAWPPSPYIYPLLLSMHFTCLEKIDVGEKYLQGLGGEYLQKHQPIGVRDIETQKRLNRNHIETYFSGCMTLTIEPFENVQKKEYICLVDVDETSANIIKKNTGREIKEITHNVKPEEISKKSFEERMKDVEELLKTYQAAHVVFTNRLHVALPCVALGTPVVLIHKEYYEKDRLETYLKYVTSFSDKEFAEQNVQEIIENPKENSKEYLTMKNNLITRCENFIKDCEKGNIIEYETLPELVEYEKYTKRLKWYQQIHENVRVKAKKNIYESEDRYKEYDRKIQQLCQEKEKLIEENKKLEDEKNKIQEKYELKNIELEQVYQSKGWKTLEKFRKIKGNLKNKRG